MNQIRKVERAARNLAAAEKALHDAIRFANGEGASLRQLARASGLSHETIRRIVASQ